MTALEKPQPITLEEYLEGEKEADFKHEYVGGFPYAMSGASIPHNVVASNSLEILFSILKGKPCRPFGSDLKVVVRNPHDPRAYYPDALVVCPPFGNEGDHFTETPLAIIEVLSPSTRRTDLSEKREAYLTLHSLKLLLFIDPKEPFLQLHRRQEDGTFATEHHTDLTASIHLSELGESSLTLADFYANLPKEDE